MRQEERGGRGREGREEGGGREGEEEERGRRERREGGAQPKCHRNFARKLLVTVFMYYFFSLASLLLLPPFSLLPPFHFFFSPPHLPSSLSLPHLLPSLPSLVSPLHLFTHSTLYWTALSRNGDTIWNMSISNTSNTRPLSIPGTRNINNLTLETLGKSLYWINSMNATIERYDLQTGQLRTIAEDAANVTGTVVESLDRWPISGCLHMSFDLYY